MKKLILLFLLMPILTSCEIGKPLIEFESNGANHISPIEFLGIENLPSPEKEGHTFEGWYLDNGLTNKLIDDEQIISNTKVYAKWIVNQYNIEFEVDGGIEIDPLTNDFGADITNLPSPEKEGYSFDGWYLESNLATLFESDTMPSKNIVLYAKWNINNYDINYYYEGELLSSFTVPFNQIVLGEHVYEAPKIEGYTFLSWSVELPTLMPAHDISIDAIYEINTYQVTYIDYNGDILLELEVDYNSTAALPDVPNNQEGYHFVKWDKTNEKISSNVTIKAVYEINIYEVTILDYDQTYLGSESIEHGSIFTTSILPQNYPGKLFFGWDIGTDIITSDLTVVAEYSDIIHISFEVDGGLELENIQIPKGKPLSVEPVTSKIDYYFVSWYLDSEFTEIYYHDHIFTSDATLYAKYSETAPEEIVIMHDKLNEVDPFHPFYTAPDKMERQKVIKEVEIRLNVKVIFKAYHEQAAYGRDRINSIKNSAIAGVFMADILSINSDWTVELVKAGAIDPVDRYIMFSGDSKISENSKILGMYNGRIYTFTENEPTVDKGLFFNLDLLRSLGLENPAELFNQNEWTWSNFEAWATSAKTALESLGKEYKVLGGNRALYAESIIPLNGSSLINYRNERVEFHYAIAGETYSFLHELHKKGLFENSGRYDAGSPLWLSGKVLIHPGELSFLDATNRWKHISFDLGYVPYPSSDNYFGTYQSAISNKDVYAVSTSQNAYKQELAFKVWNEIQTWKTKEDQINDLSTFLQNRMNDEASVSAYLSIYNQITIDPINSLGILKTSNYSWYTAANLAIINGNWRDQMDIIRPSYEDAVETYYGY